MYTIFPLTKGGMMASSSYLILNFKNKAKSIIVDTSTKRYLPEILESIKDCGLTYDDIALIILTHCHFDHCQSLKELKNILPNAKILIHQEESKLLANGDFDMPNGIWKITNAIAFLGYYLKSWTDAFKYDPVYPDIIMTQSKFSLSEYLDKDCYVLHTPGHSKGSVSVVVKDDAIVGDLMCNRIYSPVYYSIYGYDLNLICENWSKLIRAGCKTFYPGHGEKIYSYYLEDKLKSLKKKFFNKND
jgi:glyoxylase-like metal-dependent hydrolase (beta-lactamase superfamily II)